MKFLRSVLLLFVLLLAACNPSPVASPTPAASATPAVPPTATPVPSPTPLPGELVVIGEVPAATLTWLEGEAEMAGLLVSQRAADAAASLPEQARVVLWFAPAGELAALAAQHPQTQFAAVGAAGLEPAANLTVIRGDALQLSFAAGYLAVMLSPDWRVGGLFPAGQEAQKDAFINGGGYYCGDCRPGWPLTERYPRAGDPAELAVFLDQAMVEVIYLAEGTATPETLAALKDRTVAGRTVILFGAGGVPAELQGQWAATIGLDLQPALEAALPELLAGRNAGALQAAITLSNVNPGLLSEGRQELWGKVLADMETGLIQPQSVP